MKQSSTWKGSATPRSRRKGSDSSGTWSTRGQGLHVHGDQGGQGLQLHGDQIGQDLQVTVDQGGEGLQVNVDQEGRSGSSGTW